MGSISSADNLQHARIGLMRGPRLISKAFPATDQESYLLSQLLNLVMENITLYRLRGRFRQEATIVRLRHPFQRLGGIDKRAKYVAGGLRKNPNP